MRPVSDDVRGIKAANNPRYAGRLAQQARVG